MRPGITKRKHTSSQSNKKIQVCNMFGIYFFFLLPVVVLLVARTIVIGRLPHDPIMKGHTTHTSQILMNYYVLRSRRR